MSDYRSILLKHDEVWRPSSHTNPFADFPPFTDATAKAFRERYGVSLPDDLMALLKIQNGGYIRDGTVKEDHLLLSEINGVQFDLGVGTFNRFYSIIPLAELEALQLEMQEDALRDFEEEFDDYDEPLLPPEPDKLFAFFGDAHYFYALDYRGGQFDGIVYVEIETGPYVELLCPRFRDLFTIW